MERENCTVAAASPSWCGPEAVCTVTCTTPITVPMNSPFHSIRMAKPVVPRTCAQNASTTKLAVTSTRPKAGKTDASPVLCISRPVTIAPVPMPTVSGTRTSPVSEGEAPRTACR